GRPNIVVEPCRAGPGIPGRGSVRGGPGRAKPLAHAFEGRGLRAGRGSLGRRSTGPAPTRTRSDAGRVRRAAGGRGEPRGARLEQGAFTVRALARELPDLVRESFQATLPDGRGHIRLGLFDLPLAHRDSAAWLVAHGRPNGAARSLRRDTPPTGPQAYLARRSETTARERDPGRLPAVGQTPEEITPADAVRQRKLLPRPRGGVLRLLRTTGSVRDAAPALGKRQKPRG